jgi:hypothetical protein
MRISPSHQDADFHYPLNIDDKITLLEDRVVGWKLNIAEQVINGLKDSDGNVIKEPIPHAGFATLDILFSYFEMIGKYEAGYADKYESKSHFMAGVYAVFPNLNIPLPSPVIGIVGVVRTIADEVLDLLYEGVRCGLYHAGITNNRIVLTGEAQHPLSFEIQNQMLIINPHLLVSALKVHFSGYVSRLQDVSNNELRRNFEKRFNYDNGIKDEL